MLLFLASVARVFARRPRVTVLLYHSVSREPWRYAVAPGDFRRQMEYAAAHADMVPLARVLAHTKGEPLMRDAVAVTFDDVYVDFYGEALPVLTDLNIPVTVFASLREADRRELDVAFPLLSEGAYTLPAHVEVGSHALTHRKLSRLAPEEVRRELDESAQRLHERFGTRPRFVAYPKGSYSPAVMEAAKECGYEGAFTTLPRSVAAKDYPFALPRVQVDATTSFGEFRARLTAAADWYCALRRHLHI